MVGQRKLTEKVMDRDGADGGLGGQQDGQQETGSGSGEDDGGAAAETDQDGSDVGGLSGRVQKSKGIPR